jgi:hypothetical protein
MRVPPVSGDPVSHERNAALPPAPLPREALPVHSRHERRTKDRGAWKSTVGGGSAGGRDGAVLCRPVRPDLVERLHKLNRDRFLGSYYSRSLPTGNAGTEEASRKRAALGLFVQPRDLLCKRTFLCKAHEGRRSEAGPSGSRACAALRPRL